MADTCQLPETGFLRLRQILGNPKADPPIPAVIPICNSAWVGGRQVRALPQTGEARPAHNRLARRGHPRPDRANGVKGGPWTSKTTPPGRTGREGTGMSLQTVPILPQSRRRSNEAVKTRKRLNAASGAVIDRLKAAHPAFASQRPLAIGIRASLAAAHPDIDPRLLHIALSRWCGHPGYLGALIAGGPRYALDGSPCGEVSEAHRAAAVLRLQRPSRAERLALKPALQSARPGPSKVPPAVKAKPQRVSRSTNPPPSSASPVFSIGTRAILSLKSRRGA